MLMLVCKLKNSLINSFIIHSIILATRMLERNSYVRIRLKIAATDGFKEELCASDNVVFACWKKRDREEELHKANRITMNTSMHPTTLDFSFEISFLNFWLVMIYFNRMTQIFQVKKVVCNLFKQYIYGNKHAP